MRVVVAEDLFLLRDGLTRLLSAHDFQIAAAVDTAPGLLCALLEHRPDIAVVDVRMPPAFADDGLQAALAARREVPGLPVLLLSQYVEQLYARELLADQAGAVGYLLKDRVFSDDQFVDAIRAVAAGGTVMDPEVVTKLLGRRAPLSVGGEMDDTSRSAQGMTVRREVLGNAHVDRAVAAATPFTADFQDFITRYAWGEIWSRPGLSRAERSMITLTALAALRQDEELAMHVRAALRNGLTPEQISELLLHVAVYAGVPAANRAFAVAARVLAEEGQAG